MKLKRVEVQAQMFLELMARLLVLVARGCCGCRKLVMPMGDGPVLKKQW